MKGGRDDDALHGYTGDDTLVGSKGDDMTGGEAGAGKPRAKTEIQRAIPPGVARLPGPPHRLAVAPLRR
ncbi:MAG: hypothetical protein GDA53_05770 [Rhodobacteraceae bacterium]|nr:hypothetical protein [Paracoccaceae bacterium]